MAMYERVFKVHVSAHVQNVEQLNLECSNDTLQGLLELLPHCKQLRRLTLTGRMDIMQNGGAAELAKTLVELGWVEVSPGCSTRILDLSKCYACESSFKLP